MRKLIHRWKLHRLSKLSGRLRTQLWICCSAMLLQTLPFAVLLVDWLILRTPASALTRHFTLAIGGQLVLMFVLLGFTWHMRRQIKAAVRRSDRRCCIYCLYDLSASGPKGRCPECGSAFSLALLQRLWSRSVPSSGPSSDPSQPPCPAPSTRQ